MRRRPPKNDRLSYSTVMNPPSSDPRPPTDSELAAAGQTVIRARPGAGNVHERLSAASTMLHSLECQPTETSLVFARSAGARIEVVPIRGGITVGRGSDCTICLAECADFSRRHFGVRPFSGAWLLEDFGSRNGTIVDGHDGRVTRRLLRDGDFIFAGDLVFLFVNPAD